jgi:amidase
MTNNLDLAFTSALEQAQLIRRGEISPLELVQLYLDRIEKFNGKLNCYYTVAAEMALADAHAKTEQLAQTDNRADLPLFFGVPISVKDLNSVAGLPCSYGSLALKERIATYDDGLVTRLKQAGLIILGKTATSEFGCLPYTEPLGFAPTRNPWNLDYTPGGSSGGAAASVAAGLSAIAQGSDGGGSIRGPAFCCGLVGIKPSRGRISFAPVGDYQSGIATNGPLARTVADAAALLDVMSGYTVGDPYWLDSPAISFLEATRQVPPSLKIGYASTVIPDLQPDPICQQQLEETVDLLESLGHILEPTRPDFSSMVEPFTKIWQAGAASVTVPTEFLSPFSRWLAAEAGSAGDYLRAVQKIQLISRDIVAFLLDFDVLLLPTYLHPPITIGEWADLNPTETVDKIIRWIAPCPLANASGLPAIALPTGFTPEGLPLGIQLVGRPGAELTLIAIASQLETAKPWSDLLPKSVYC